MLSGQSDSRESSGCGRKRVASHPIIIARNNYQVHPIGGDSANERSATLMVLNALSPLFLPTDERCKGPAHRQCRMS